MSGSRIHTPQLEDIPELIHRIQSLLPAKKAARTCILSKSWLHAWSTIPTLRFQPESQMFATDEQEKKYKKVIDHTLQRYHRDNISIESLDLQLRIHNNQEWAFVAEKWIQPIVSKSCLKELSLKIWGLNDSFTLPNELFSSENLNTIKVTAEKGTYLGSYPFIKCVTLRVLDLESVNITEEVLHNLLSTCTLLEKIKLQFCEGLKNVIVKNLRHLCELVITSVILEINDVPSLRFLEYHVPYRDRENPVPFKMDSLGSVTELSINGVIVDDAKKGTYLGGYHFIKCVTLRVLDLHSVNITEEVLHNLLSTCTLLEKVKLWDCRGLKNVMVKNLRRLRKLVITSVLLEINDVPSLRLLHYLAPYRGRENPVPFKMDSLGSVTELSLNGVIVDDAEKGTYLGSYPFLKCVTLRVLDLESVNITEEVLHNLLSTCTFLEKIKLWFCKGLKNVIVKNLRHLRELVITSVLLEINDVPSLRLLDYHAHHRVRKNPVPFKMDSLGSVTELSIEGVIVDDAFLDIIKSKFLLLECLTLGIENCGLESLVITSVSLKDLTLDLKLNRQVNVEVYAPKLLHFQYNGGVHGLLFPTIAPKHINLRYCLCKPLDQLFFLKLMNVLNSSSKFNIYITEQSPVPPLNIDVDDLRRRCSFPVTNMHRLRLNICSRSEHLWKKRFFDAFFSIFHPRYIMSTKLVVREIMMMERQPTDLKDVELKNPYYRKWETLTSSLKSVLDALTDSDLVECKLNWVSQ